jgi:hypothetical protein
MGIDYLRAFHATGIGVKACPIGPIMPMPSWMDLMNLFMVADPQEGYVNVVVAPPGLSMGFAHTAAAVAPGVAMLDGNKAPPVPGAPQVLPSQEIVYQPQTALAGLYTVGVPNIAVTMSRPKPPDEAEVRALQQYSFVLSPSDDDAQALRLIGVDAIHMLPDPGQLSRILDALLSG